jgi:hypothetical protein
MKLFRTFSACLMLFASGFSTGISADSVTPEEPDAFQPFLVEVEIGPPARFLTVELLQIEESAILIGYRSHPVGFLPPDSSWLDVTIAGLPPGTYSVRTAYIPDLATDDIEIVDTDLSVTVADAPATQSVHAFFHTGIEHYFITASDNEADGLLAQNGWEIVDFGFNVWHADDPAPEAAVPVCRFYSELVNSHFYTGSANECAMLQEEGSGWTYEGIAFQALLPVKGACPAGTTPVWRLYNDRAAEFDSNHRFVASGDTYRAMIAEGWIGEGVAFCSPPESV